MKKKKLYTIGFTQKNAEKFFSLLIENNIKSIFDIRLNNTSQLAGFAKSDDLKFFLKAVAGIEYYHVPEMAPTNEIFEEFKKNNGDWKIFQKQFIKLISSRKIEDLPIIKKIENACLLCSEHLPEKCHRRLTAEYLAEKFENIEIIHLF